MLFPKLCNSPAGHVLVLLSNSPKKILPSRNEQKSKNRATGFDGAEPALNSEGTGRAESRGAVSSASTSCEIPGTSAVFQGELERKAAHGAGASLAHG